MEIAAFLSIGGCAATSSDTFTPLDRAESYHPWWAACPVMANGQLNRRRKRLGVWYAAGRWRSCKT